MRTVTNKELREAQETIILWFLQTNQNTIRKPITMIDTDIKLGNEQFRLFNFMTFYGRDELPPMNLDDEEEAKK